MSTSMSAFVQIYDEDIAEQMAGDDKFAVNVLLSATRRIAPESLKDAIEELPYDEQNRLHTFAQELAWAIETPTEETVK